MGGGVDAVVQLAEAIKVLRPTSHFPLLDVAIDPTFWEMCDFEKKQSSFPGSGVLHLSSQ